MRILRACCILSTLVFASSFANAFAQQPAPQSYQTLLARLKQGDKTVDFFQIRRAYADSPDFTGGSDDDQRKAMFDAYNEGDLTKALAHSKKLLDGYYLDIEAHQIAYLADRQLHIQAEADFHHEIARGLISAIFQTGDCKTQKSACEVLSTHEEYVILQVLGLRPGRQSLVSADGHNYDVLEAIDSKTQEKVTIYFNIDKPLGYMQKLLSK